MVLFDGAPNPKILGEKFLPKWGLVLTDNLAPRTPRFAQN